MNEFFFLVSVVGMIVGFVVCVLIVGLVLVMFFVVWELVKWCFVVWVGLVLVIILCGLLEILVVLFIYFGFL